MSRTMRLTGSGLGRARKCPPSVVLPQTRTIRPDATFGDVVHAFLRDVPAMGVESAIARQPEEHRAALGIIETDGLPLDPDAYAQEVAFAYDPTTDTARELGRGMSRDQAYARARDGEVCCTVDVVGLTPTAVIVPDYKSGWQDLGPVKENMQLRFGALCAARAYGRDAAEVSIIRVHPGRTPWHDRASLNVLDIDETAAIVRRIVEAVAAAERALAAGEQLVLTIGPHCTYCPALSACPAQMNLVRTAVETAFSRRLPGPEILTEENFGAAWNILEVLEAAVSRYRGTLEDFTRARPVDVGGGYVIGPRPFVTDKIDPALARTVLTELFDAQAGEEALKMTTGKERIEDALRSAKKRHPGLVIKKAKESVLQMLRERGGIETSVSYPVSKHKPPVLPAGQSNAPELKE